MTLNKTGIEWCDRSWNPVSGCLYGCSFCYARKIAENPFYIRAFPNGFKPTFHPERLTDPIKTKKPQTIFVVSMGDLFGNWVKADWIVQTLKACYQAPQHTYIFLTKNPERYVDFIPEQYMENWWYGVSITGKEDLPRLEILKQLGDARFNRFVSFEPLLTDTGNIDLKGIKQIIIGAQTNPLLLPPAMATANVYFAAKRDGAKVFYKDSIVKCHPKEYTYPRELAWGLHK
jgi:protein gp37